MNSTDKTVTSREPTLKPSDLPPSAATAESPMAFINRMAGNTPAPEAPPTVSVTPSKTSQEAIVKNNVPNDPVQNAAIPVDPMKDILAKIEAKKAAEAEAEKNPPPEFKDGSDDIKITDKEDPEPVVEAQTDLPEEDLLDETKDPKVESFKKLRSVANEYKFKVDTVTSELETTKKELEDYKTGKVVPETLHEYEARIQELEKFEKIHNLKNSKDFRRKFVEPLNELGGKLDSLATQYGVSEDIIYMAMNAKTQRERDEILEDNFTTLAALEAKQIIDKMGGLRVEAHKAQEEPVAMLKLLQEEGQRMEEARREEKISRITNSSRSAWVKAHKNIVNNKLALELIPTDDPKHNSEVVQPLLKQASLEFTKVVKELAKLGIEDLPEELATAIASAFQLAHATPVAFRTRDAAINHLETIEQNTKRTYNYERPRLGQSSVPANGPGREAPIGGTRASAVQAAQNLIQVGREIAKSMPK